MLKPILSEFKKATIIFLGDIIFKPKAHDSALLHNALIFVTETNPNADKYPIKTSPEGSRSQYMFTSTFTWEVHNSDVNSHGYMILFDRTDSKSFIGVYVLYERERYHS